MAEDTHFTAIMGMVTISTANSNLDGTGTVGTIIEGDDNGLLIKSVTIKAITNVTEGMIRLYTTSGSGDQTRLVAEIEVPAVTKTSRYPSFERKLDLDLCLNNNEFLKASTQNAESFNIIAEGLAWSYSSTSVQTDTTEYTANTGMTVISTANSNLDGTGTLGTVLTSVGPEGCRIKSISVKAIQNVTPGMVRLYVQDTGGSTTRLFTEIPVVAVTKSYAATSFAYDIIFPDYFNIPNGYKIMASTENAESFSVIAEAWDWDYQ